MLMKNFHRNAIIIIVFIIVTINLTIIYIKFKAIWFITIRFLQDLFFPVLLILIPLTWTI
jgi:hypothetical protein